ncbi:MAG: pilus assembly protein PilZ [Candidatus Angelobacter sp. Gp1-AA117]|nr:MAG: pilus assembly protein PilZ [Candidatus Angelobacter sp. Gp1-AA117]
MPEYATQRRHARYNCDAGVEIRIDDARSGYWGTLTDISLGGCYINTFSPLPVGTAVVLLIKIDGQEINTKAKVVTSHPGVGMGLEFAEFLAQADEAHLQSLIGSLVAQVVST